MQPPPPLPTLELHNFLPGVAEIPSGQKKSEFDVVYITEYQWWIVNAEGGGTPLSGA